MAQIGCLGDILFTVSSEKIQTIKNLSWSGSARYSVHRRHMSNAMIEFTGLEPDEISFDMELLVYAGVSVMSEIAKLWAYERDHRTLPLVIGDKAYGKYRWCISDHKIKGQTYDANGNLSGATVSIRLMEYTQ